MLKAVLKSAFFGSFGLLQIKQKMFQMEQKMLLQLCEIFWSRRLKYVWSLPDGART